jgi:hypothetical protein
LSGFPRMAYGTISLNDFTTYDRVCYPVPSRPITASRTLNMVGSAGLVCITLACAWTMYVNVFAPDTGPVVIATPTAPPRAPKTYSALLDPAYSLGVAPGTFSKIARAKLDNPVAAATPEQATPQMQAAAIPLPIASPINRQFAESVPLPLRRPAELRALQSVNLSVAELAHVNKAPIPSPAESEEASIFQKIFPKPQAGPALAYASPDGGLSGERSPAFDKWTAVYDISAHTVYMPDGTRLEAHSGLGSRLDDPRYADEKMRGVTPPHVYDLQLREAPFHGVQALRLNPVGGESEIFGRAGLLAHTYMLGPNGDSNGCVSFRNYDAFLRAYMNQQVKRLVVVARLG